MRQSLNVLSCALARVRLAEFTVIRPTYSNMSLHRLGQLPGLQCKRYTASGCTRAVPVVQPIISMTLEANRDDPVRYFLLTTTLSPTCVSCLLSRRERKILVFFLNSWTDCTHSTAVYLYF